MKKFNRTGAVVLMVFVASILATGNALAHALLIRSFPPANSEVTQSPSKIEMWFSEPLEAEFSAARLLTTSGDEIPVGVAELDPNNPAHLSISIDQLSPGIYTVAWKTLSRTDGHEWYGSFPFTILNPDGSHPGGTATVTAPEARKELPSPMQAVSRWLALMGGVLLLSVPIFFKFIVGDMTGLLETRLNALAVKISALAVITIILGSWLQVAIQSSRLESLALLPQLVYGTHSGALALARQALGLAGFLSILPFIRPTSLGKSKNWVLVLAKAYEVLLLALILTSGLQGEGTFAYPALAVVGVSIIAAGYCRRGATLAQRVPWNLFLFPALAALLYFSLGSHAGAVSGSFWAVLSDYIHLLATSVWIGGLILLPLVIASLRGDSAAPDKPMLGRLFRRYGYLAKSSFFFLLTSGLFNSLVQFPSFASVIVTSYGRVLLVKLALAFAVWGISILSSRILRRNADPAQFPANLRRFILQISLAALIGLTLMVATSVLVQTQPPERQTANPDFSFHNMALADDLQVHVQVTPNQVGKNQFFIQLRHADGSPIGGVQLVRALFEYEDAQIGQSRAELNPLGADVFGIEGAYLNQPGSWKLSIYVRRRGMDDTVADLHIQVPDPADDAGKTNPFQNPVSTLPVNGIFAAGMILIGVEILRWRSAYKHAARPYFFAFVSTALVLILLGLVIGVPLALSFISP